MITEGTPQNVVRARSKKARVHEADEVPAGPVRNRRRAAAKRARVDEAPDALEPGLLWKRLAWIAAAVAFAFVTISMVSYSAGDAPAPGVFPHNDPPLNLCGRVGAFIAHYAYSTLGWGSVVLMALGALSLAVIATGRRVDQLPIRVVGACMMAAAIAGLQALLLPASGPVPALPGGLVGTLGSARLVDSFSSVGSFLVLTLMLCVGAVVALDIWAILVAMWTSRAIYAGAKTSGTLALNAARAASERRRQAAEARRVRLDDVSDDDELPELSDSTTSRVLRGARGAPPVRTVQMKKGVAVQQPQEEDPSLFDPSASGTIPAGDPRRKVERPRVAPIVNDEEPADEGEEAAEEPAKPKTFTAEELRAKIAKLPVRFAAVERRSATEEDLREVQNQGGAAEDAGPDQDQMLAQYRFPGLDLLEEPEVGFSQVMENFVREQAEALERALKEYRIDGEVVGVESGPVITLYEVRLAPGTKVAVLQAVASDLARSLKSVNIRIVPNTAGRDTVGVEVPNAKKEKVRLKELMTRSDIHSKMMLPMFLGKDASGEPMICDLSTMPHMLIAGTTGSGKSVCMNTIIMSFLYTKKPNELKLVLVDPKMVELSQFKDIPHLMCPVVTEMGKAAAILEWAVNKMDERYELLAEAGCRDIASYNALEWEEIKERLGLTTPEEEARVPRKLPYMVFVIDELADLMMTNKEVEHSIVRIAQKARAVGMHLIVATQRPQANVVTGLIKSNMPGRLAFKVASGMDSRIVLDQKGGELLLGQGDMLYLSPRSSELIRAQGTLVDDKEIRRVVKFMKEVASPTFERSLMQIRSGMTAEQAESAAAAAGVNGNFNMGDRDGFQAAQEDPMFDQAVEIVIESRRGSVSMLQRRLAIGYTRAARLIEMMGEAGILGGHKGTVSRDVIMTIDEWRAIKAQAMADAELQGGPEGELNSHPKTGETLEATQAIVNRSSREEPPEDDVAFEDEDGDEAPEPDDEYADDEEADEDAGDEDADDPPFEIETRGGNRTHA